MPVLNRGSELTGQLWSLGSKAITTERPLQEDVEGTRRKSRVGREEEGKARALFQPLSYIIKRTE